MDMEKFFDKNEVYYNELQNNLYKKLSDIFINTCFFSFIPMHFTESYNFRTSFFIAYFIKDYIKGKHFCHIGGASGDLELLLSKYAKKITIIEMDKNRLQHAIQKKKNSLYSCPVEIINDNFYNVNINADVYFTWCGEKNDNSIIQNIIEKNKKCKIFSPCLPIYFYKKYINIILDRFSFCLLIPFDENLDLSYYSARMFKNKNSIIIEQYDKVYLYKCNDDCISEQQIKYENNNIKLEKVISSKDFNFENYEEYNHHYLSTKLIKSNNSPAARINSPNSFLEQVQYNLRGYLPLGVLDIT